MKRNCFIAMLLLGVSSISFAAITGCPDADGWTAGGNSLSNGVYVRNNVNYPNDHYGFETYSANITVASGSLLNISDGDYSWSAGDTVLGIGGKFAGITAEQAGWDAFSGNPVNSLLSAANGPKLTAKFGTSEATFSASTIAPGYGNGAGSLGTNGGVGAVQVRTSGWFGDYVKLPDQVSDTTWSNSTGLLMLLDKADHIDRNGASRPDKRVARVIWYWDSVTENVVSWELLLNVSLLDRTAPVGFTGLTPAAGNLCIASVQDRESAYTDAMVTIVPEPATMLLLAAGAAGLLRKKNR